MYACGCVKNHMFWFGHARKVMSEQLMSFVHALYRVPSAVIRIPLLLLLLLLLTSTYVCLCVCVCVQRAGTILSFGYMLCIIISLCSLCWYSPTSECYTYFRCILLLCLFDVLISSDYVDSVDPLICTVQPLNTKKFVDFFIAFWIGNLGI